MELKLLFDEFDFKYIGEDQIPYTYSNTLRPATNIVCFTGDRVYKKSYVNAIARILDHIVAAELSSKITKIYVGDCPTGVDHLVTALATVVEIQTKIFKAEWDKYHKAAGPRRNADMLKAAKETGLPVELVAIHSDFSQSRGTKSCVNLALKQYNIPVRFPLDSIGSKKS